MQCLYLGPEQPGKNVDGRQAYDCHIHGACVQAGDNYPLPSCAHCKSRITINDPKLATTFQDPLLISDRYGARTHALRHMLQGCAAFLVAGGPSAKSLPLHLLNQRGVWSMAVNNMAGFCRPNAFVCADPPLKFHHGIWLDPCMMKFIPSVKFTGSRNRLKMKEGEEFKRLKVAGQEIKTTTAPNVWGFNRRQWILPDETFFTDDAAAWGNQNAGVEQTGGQKTVMTMLLGLRILYYLGARTIYLVGVDFHMSPDLDSYAFGTGRTDFKREDYINLCESNNRQFAVANNWLCALQTNGTFKKFGLEVYNCFAGSGLRAFEYVPFDVALKDTLKNFPAEPFDLDGWYEKK
jgi:hypothetical protein